MYKLTGEGNSRSRVKKLSSLVLTATLVLQPVVPAASAAYSNEEPAAQDNNVQQQSNDSSSVTENVYALRSANDVSNPQLTAVGDNVNNLVKLNWTSSKAGEEYYMVYQKDTGGNGLDEYQSIPLKTDIKVLNVYPDIPQSAGLQEWMQNYGNPSGYTMQVDKVAISDFNGNDPTVNYSKYLTKNPDGSYPYDVLYFGAWDVNAGRDLSQESYEAVDAFVQYGGGVLVGHDTASFAHTYFIQLAQQYLNMDVKFQEGYWNPDIPPLGSDQVLIQRRGFPMNYPYALGDVGSVLYTPTSHSYFQFAKGDIWFKYANINWGSGPEISSYQDQPGTNNFYLTTWNNAAMIQTGHSNGYATEDEQKILTNTLFYLAQISTANSFDDRMSQDVAAPDEVAGEASVSPGSAAGKLQIHWNDAADNGSSYSYYLKTVSFTDASSTESAETSATVTTGIKGYAVKIDTDSTDVDPGSVVNTLTNSFEADNLERGVTYYAHIKAIDNAANLSAVYTIPFTTEAPVLTAISTDPSGAVNDGKTRLTVAETVGQGNRLVYINAGSGTVDIPAVGEELTGYSEMPANGLVPAANGDNMGVAEVDAAGRVVRFGQVVAQSSLSAAPLTVTSIDPAGVENDGKTRMVASVRSGNKLVYVNFGKGEVEEPSQGEALTGYTDLPEGGIIAAEKGDMIGIAEIGADGKVLRYGVAAAIVINEAQAKGLAASATDPVGEGTDGLTKVAVNAASGNKIVYVNFKKGQAVIPDTGSSLDGLGYEVLPANGLIAAENGDLLGLAEVDSAGKVVRYGTTKAVVQNESAATGLPVSSTDPAGEENNGKTKLEVGVQAGAGNKFVYLNFGKSSVTSPSVGAVLDGYAELPVSGLVDAAHGDAIGIAEVDEAGKVVKFGWVTAVSYSEAAAKGLPVTASDPDGSANDGKTLIEAKAAEGLKLVYVNFGTGDILFPETGELLAGYTELPADGLIPANDGDHIAVAEIDADGRVVRFGHTDAKVIQYVESSSPGTGGVQISPTPSAAPKGVMVLVNGKVEYVGTADVTSDDGRTLTTINVDEAQLQAKLDAEGTGVVVTIPWTEKSDIITGLLSGNMIKQMQAKTATLVLDTPAGAYKIPTDQINLTSLSGQLGQNIKPEDVILKLRIATATQEANQAAERTAAKAGVTLVAAPVTFTVTAQYGGKSIEITDYPVYVERTVVLPANVDPNKITTGTVLEPNGTLRHVPTKITRQDEVYIAQINSLTNSNYGVIWNPLEFADVANHWSKAAVNDMASRLVVNGIGSGKYNPNADITRAEFAAIMVRGLGLRLDEGTVNFTDVKASDWYASVVHTAYKFGLISGYEDGSFRPQSKITRQEAMTIIAHMMQTTGLKQKLSGDLSDTLLGYKDANAVAAWAKEGVTLSVAAQVVNGRTADQLASKAYITRAETAAIIQRLLQKSGLI